MRRHATEIDRLLRRVHDLAAEEGQHFLKYLAEVALLENTSTGGAANENSLPRPNASTID
ncbi:hypothetical protein [Shinella sp. JR1-6]|uniref:hypothetical protein n=1 Tax=Shinella sp. JR1-6 TaxID=2527671 RepID=UPI00102D5135|nr:hypothetical protein [Shinella sp. JR1-6]TAA55281.1 hypothetical protein EXZ48_24935 [Shinella sp. JR1-6]